MSMWGKIRGCGWYFWDDFTVLHPVFKCFERFSTCYFKNECLRLWPFLFPFLSWHNLAAVVSTTLKPGHRLFTRQISCVLWDRQRLQVVVWHMSKQWSKHSLVLIYVEGYIAQLHIDSKISMWNCKINHYNNDLKTVSVIFSTIYLFKTLVSTSKAHL